jgi:hypothetical protein
MRRRMMGEIADIAVVPALDIAGSYLPFIQPAPEDLPVWHRGRSRVRGVAGSGSCYARMMDSFREFIAGSKTSKAPTAFFHFTKDDAVTSTLLNTLFNEVCQKKDLGEGRSIMFHCSHVGSQLCES